MPSLGWSSLWPAARRGRRVRQPHHHPDNPNDDYHDDPAPSQKSLVSRVSKKSPGAAPPPPPSSSSSSMKSGTIPSASGGGSVAPAAAASLLRTGGGNRRTNSWGRGLRTFSSSSKIKSNSKRSLRGGNPSSKTTDSRFQDPGTASTLSLPPPSEADFSMALSSSSAFFFRAAHHRSPSWALRPPSPALATTTATAPPPSPPLVGMPPPSTPQDEEEQPVEEESLSSSHSTLCPAPPPASSPPLPLPLLEGGTAPALLQGGCPNSYEMRRNDRRGLGFMAFHFTSAERDALPEAAVRLSSRETGRPILRYRLPSCPAEPTARDVEVAAAVWSHPLLVEAAQSLFVAVCLLEEAPKKAGAPAPAASLDVLDSAGAKLVPTLVSAPSVPPSRDDNAISRRTVARAMVRALESHCPSRPVPRYLCLLLEEEGEAGRAEIAVVGTDDPVRGEVEFAGLEGVVATRTGSVDRQRVVEVTYDPQKLSFGCVTRFALKRKVGGVVYHRTNDERMSAQVEIERLRDVAETKPFAGTIQPDFDPKPDLRRTPLRFVPLTPIQATRANRLVHLGRFDEAVHLLSPRQGLILMDKMHKSAHKSLHDVIDVPILSAWIGVCDKQQQHQQSPRAAVEQVGCVEDSVEGDDLTCDFEQPPSYYEYNRYSSERLPPGYPWRGF